MHKKLQILVCDGTPLVKELLVQQLQGFGHEVIATDDADQAADTFRNSSPIDLIITGYRLSPRSGLELIQEIKQISPKTPICLLTGEPGLEDEAQQAGANFLIHKPYRTIELEMLLQKL